MKNEIALIELGKGEQAEITKIRAGWTATKRLADLGLTPKTKIKVLEKTMMRGPIEIEVRGSKLALGKGLALKVLVRPV